MKKVIYNTYGGPEVLEIIEVDAPRASPEEVSIQVKAVSMNPLDWKLRGGLMKLGPGKNLGRSIGIDFAGVVAEVGDQVKGLQVGDEVFGAVKDPMKEGALAETITAQPEQVALVPDNISPEQAAAMVSVGAPALMALHDKVKLRRGDEVLIHGASGGVGMLAIQIAKRAGARVTAVSSTKGQRLAHAGPNHRSPRANQQRVSQEIPKPPQRIARCGRRDVEPSRRPTHVGLVEQDIQGPEMIEIDPLKR